MKVFAKISIWYLLILDLVILGLGITYLLIALSLNTENFQQEHQQLRYYLNHHSFWDYLRYFFLVKEPLRDKLTNVFNFSVNKNLILVFSGALNLIISVFPLFTILLFLSAKKLFHFLYFESNPTLVKFNQKNKKNYKKSKRNLKDSTQHNQKKLFKVKKKALKHEYKITKKTGKFSLKIDFWYQKRVVQRMQKFSFQKLVSFLI